MIVTDVPSFVYPFRGKSMEWVPVAEFGDRILCRSPSGEHVLFATEMIRRILLLEAFRKRLCRVSSASDIVKR